MRSMTGYGHGEIDHGGTKFSVELNSVNRKQSDIVINLPRDLAELEPRIRQTINENISRGRTNAFPGTSRKCGGSVACDRPRAERRVDRFNQNARARGQASRQGSDSSF